MKGGNPQTVGQLVDTLTSKLLQDHASRGAVGTGFFFIQVQYLAVASWGFGKVYVCNRKAKLSFMPPPRRIQPV